MSRRPTRSNNNQDKPLKTSIELYEIDSKSFLSYLKPKKISKSNSLNFESAEKLPQEFEDLEKQVREQFDVEEKKYLHFRYLSRKKDVKKLWLGNYREQKEKKNIVDIMFWRSDNEPTTLILPSAKNPGDKIFDSRFRQLTDNFFSDFDKETDKLIAAEFFPPEEEMKSKIKGELESAWKKLEEENYFNSELGKLKELTSPTFNTEPLKSLIDDFNESCIKASEKLYKKTEDIKNSYVSIAGEIIGHFKDSGSANLIKEKLSDFSKEISNISNENNGDNQTKPSQRPVGNQIPEVNKNSGGASGNRLPQLKGNPTPGGLTPGGQLRPIEIDGKPALNFVENEMTVKVKEKENQNITLKIPYKNSGNNTYKGNFILRLKEESSGEINLKYHMKNDIKRFEFTPNGEINPGETKEVVIFEGIELTSPIPGKRYLAHFEILDRKSTVISENSLKVEFIIESSQDIFEFNIPEEAIKVNSNSAKEGVKIKVPVNYLGDVKFTENLTLVLANGTSSEVIFSYPILNSGKNSGKAMIYSPNFEFVKSKDFNLEYDKAIKIKDPVFNRSYTAIIEIWSKDMKVKLSKNSFKFIIEIIDEVEIIYKQIIERIKDLNSIQETEGSVKKFISENMNKMKMEEIINHFMNKLNAQLQDEFEGILNYIKSQNAEIAAFGDEFIMSMIKANYDPNDPNHLKIYEAFNSFF